MLTEIDLTLEGLTATLVLATLLLVIVSILNAVATQKLARVADREFRATKLPIIALKWTYKGYGQSPEGHHITFVAEFQKLNGVPISALTPTVHARRISGRSVRAGVFQISFMDGDTFQVSVDVEPEIDYGSEPRGECFVVQLDVAVWSPVVGGSDLWTSRSTIRHTGGSRFSISIDAPGLRRQQDLSFRQRLKAEFQQWKREMVP